MISHNHKLNLDLPRASFSSIEPEDDHGKDHGAEDADDPWVTINKFQDNN